MTIWSEESKELVKLYESIRGQHPALEREVERLIRTEDENMVLVYSRRALEVIVGHLCEAELNRPRGTDPLKGIIDRLNKEEKVPQNIIVPMQNLNSLSVFGAHPKQFDPKQVKPVFHYLAVVIEWYLEYAGPDNRKEAERQQDPAERGAAPLPADSGIPSRKKYIMGGLIILAALSIIVIFVVFDILKGGKDSRNAAIESIAILPFDNYTDDAQLDNVLSGMHSSLIGAVGQVSGLRIKSGTSSKAYKKFNLPLSQIATEHDVDAFIEASVWSMEDSIVINFRIITMYPEEKQIWAGEFREERSKVLRLYNRITKTIAQEVNITLTPSEQSRLDHADQVHKDAYEAYLMGRHFWEQLGPASLQRALDYFTQATEIDPDWAVPYAWLAITYAGLMQMGLASPVEVRPLIGSYLERALELDTDFTGVHFLSAAISTWTDWNWEKGENEFQKALEVNPNNAGARIYYGHLLSILGRTDEGLMHGEIAIELDPLNPLIQALYAVLLLHAGQPVLAEDHVLKALELDPANYFAKGVLEGVMYVKGDLQGSLELLLELHRPVKDEIRGEILDTYRNEGYKAALGDILRYAEEGHAIDIRSPHVRGVFYLRIDRVTRALDYFEMAFDVRDPNLPYITTMEVNIEKIKREPRFLDLLEKMVLSGSLN